MLAAMNRRQLLLGLAATGLAPSLHAAEREKKKSGKKGWCGYNADLHKLFGAHWYYTWTPGWQSEAEIEFVPMIKKEADLERAEAVKRNSDAKFLLGFNEPERKDQGDVTVERAIALWPKIEEMARDRKLPVSSPAPSSDKLGMDWLAEFMKQAKKKDLKIDFIAVHYYRSRKAEDLERFINELAREYRLPIWLTEFNGWAGPEDEHIDFLKKSLKFLEKSEDVQRYAYFDPKPGKPHSLHDGNGQPTKLGKIYQEAGI